MGDDFEECGFKICMSKPGRVEAAALGADGERSLMALSFMGTVVMSFSFPSSSVVGGVGGKTGRISFCTGNEGISFAAGAAATGTDDDGVGYTLLWGVKSGNGAGDVLLVGVALLCMAKVGSTS